MCIRDSPHPGNKGKLQMDATVCDADIKYPTDLDLLNESCLLYTSDAADDLLCVDLGGRRIFKK